MNHNMNFMNNPTLTMAPATIIASNGLLDAPFSPFTARGVHLATQLPPQSSLLFDCDVYSRSVCRENPPPGSQISTLHGHDGISLHQNNCSGGAEQLPVSHEIPVYNESAFVEPQKEPYSLNTTFSRVPTVSVPGPTDEHVGNLDVGHHGQKDLSSAPFMSAATLDLSQLPTDQVYVSQSMTKEPTPAYYKDHGVPMHSSVGQVFAPCHMRPSTQVLGEETPVVQNNFPDVSSTQQILRNNIYENINSAYPTQTGEPQNGSFPDGQGNCSIPLTNEEMLKTFCGITLPDHPTTVAYDEQVHHGYNLLHFSNSGGQNEGRADGNVHPSFSMPVNGSLKEYFPVDLTATAFQSNDGRIQCSQCTKEFGNMASWKRHATRVHRIASATKICCEICSLEFRNDENLLRHLKTAHESVAEPLTCPQCSASFSSKRVRALHMVRIHSKSSALSVNQTVSKKKRKKRAPRTSKTNLHKCTVCDYVSRWKGNISRHVKAVHLDLRPFFCDACPKRFNSPSNLAVHKLKHAKEVDKETEDSV